MDVNVYMIGNHCRIRTTEQLVSNSPSLFASHSPSNASVRCGPPQARASATLSLKRRPSAARRGRLLAPFGNPQSNSGFLGLIRQSKKRKQAEEPIQSIEPLESMSHSKQSQEPKKSQEPKAFHSHEINLKPRIRIYCFTSQPTDQAHLPLWSAAE